MAKAKTKKAAATSAKPAKKSPEKKKTATKKKATATTTVKVDRRAPKAEERRNEEDRRQETVEVEGERREAPQRRKVARRRQIDPTTCERDYNDDEIEFMHALDAYKRAAGRMFPTCSEILEVVRDLGYHRLNPEQIATLGLNKNVEEVDAEGELVAGEANDSREASLVGTAPGGDTDLFQEDSLEDFEG